MFSPRLLDHFERPRNAGALAGATASADVENPACGDLLRLELRVENGRIAAAGFRAKGCVAAIACASALTELVEGKSVSAARKISPKQLQQALAPVPKESTHAIHLALDALKAALKAALDASRDSSR